MTLRRPEMPPPEPQRTTLQPSVGVLTPFTTDSSLQASLRRLGAPTTWVGQPTSAGGNRGRLRDAVRGLASGRSSATPFVAFAGANLGLLLIGLLITLVVALIVWLTGLT